MTNDSPSAGVGTEDPQPCICTHPEAVHATHSPRRCGGCEDCGELPWSDPPDGQAHEYRPCDCPGFEAA